MKLFLDLIAYSTLPMLVRVFYGYEGEVEEADLSWPPG